ncbi:hypothetical protein [Sphingobacterium kitahiroshimense]|uniref:Uncharacterized protein n=1 Tax=Sphingobacterium kitahiroshimense TaxID=470446 RepID=A0ABV0BTK8_9SPHI
MKIKEKYCTTYMNKILFFIMLILFVTSCNKSEILPVNDNFIDIGTFRNNFEQHSGYKSTDSLFINSSFKSVIDWNNYVFASDDTVYVKVNVIDKVEVMTSETSKVFLNNYIWIRGVKTGQSWNYSQLTFIPENNSQGFTGSIISKSLITGEEKISYFKNNLKIDKKILYSSNIGSNSGQCKYGYVNGVLNVISCGKDNGKGEDYWGGSPIDYETVDPFASGGGGGGDGNPSTPFNPESPEEEYVQETSSDAIDLENKLKCFNTVPNNANTGYKIRICADLPDDSNPKALMGPDRVGHSFITLIKTNGSVSVIENFGFYPQSGNKSVFGISVASQIVDDGVLQHQYNASITTNVSQQQFQQILDNAINKSKMKYNLKDYNCTDYAVDVYNAGMSQGNKITVADWVINSGYYGVGERPVQDYGTTPSGLYKTISDLKNSGRAGASTATGKSSYSTNCN